LPSKGTTAAAMAPEEKNNVSHRGIAFKKLVQMITNYING
jgi:inosine/xanthosine triphosphate pyrophosphatase family protein